MMYLHLGRGSVIDTREIVGIFDLDNSSQSRITRAFLASAQKKGQIVNAAEDELPKSFIVTCDKSGRRVYLSQMSAATLLKRAN